jgi:hypothetical protein
MEQNIAFLFSEISAQNRLDLIFFLQYYARCATLDAMLDSMIQ